MNAPKPKPLLVHPLLSEKPTGMGVAAAGLNELLVPEFAGRAPRLEAALLWINDRLSIGLLRTIVRLAVVQIVPLLVRHRPLLFTSHHAPLWRTGRHDVIVYDLIALHHAKQSRTQHFFYRHLLPRVLRNARRVVTISAAARDEFATAFPRITTQPMIVIPAFSSRLERMRSPGSPLVARRNAATFIVIGARYAHKNLDLALRALAEWPKRASVPRPRLVVAGCRRELWPGLAALEAQGAVEVITFASTTQLDDLLHTGTALLYLSHEEGQGLPPLEAMAVGCPAICSDIAVLRETCAAAALYVPPDDVVALQQIMSAIIAGSIDAELERLQATGRARVDLFRAAALRTQWAAFFQQPR